MLALAEDRGPVVCTRRNCRHRSLVSSAIVAFIVLQALAAFSIAMVM